MNKIMEMEREVEECYTFFQENHEKVKLDKFENMLTKLKKNIVQLTITNLVNIVDRVIEDGSVTKEGYPKQFNVNSIQIAGDDAIVLITHEVLGFDEKDKKFLLDNDYTYIPYKNVLRVF